MNQLIEIARNLFKPKLKIDPEAIATDMVANEKEYDVYDALAERMIANEKEYKPLTSQEFDELWYGSNASDHLPPVMVACSTAMDDYLIQPMTELKYEPLAEWVCQWCGNMWTSDITSCEKCGGPREDDRE